MNINDRARAVVVKTSCLRDAEPTNLYCSDDKYSYYFSKPYAINEYGIEAITVKAVDRNNNNNFLLMKPPFRMLERSNGISLYEIKKIQDFVTRNLFLIDEIAREVDN